MKREVEAVLKYFAKFQYRPSFEELHSFMSVKIEKSRLREYVNKASRDTPWGYISEERQIGKHEKISVERLRNIQRYIKILAYVSSVRFVGLSGSMALFDTKRYDDIDLFIISQNGRLWTARFVSIALAFIFGLKRSRTASRARNKVCLNLFFEDAHLQIRREIRTEYMAHEVLQTVPIIDVNRTYRRFIMANQWVVSFFPNIRAKGYYPSKKKQLPYCYEMTRKNSRNIVGDVLETILRLLQLLYMKKPAGDERLEEHQLWFHPRNYQKRVVR